MLRIDYNIIFTIVNLIFLFVLMRVFLYKPICNMLQKRKDEIEHGYAEADGLKQEALQMRAVYESNTKEAEDHSREIIAKAKDQAQEEYKRIVAQANADAEQIITKARENAAEERANALRCLEAEMADMVIEAAKKVVGKSNTSLIDSRLYDEFLTGTGEANDSEAN